MSVPVIDGPGAGAGEFPSDGVLAHRHASLQHDCWVWMEGGALVWA